MDWVRLSRAKEVRRMEKTANDIYNRQSQQRDNRDITNGALTGGAFQLGRISDRPCIASGGQGSRGCTRVG